MAQSIRSCDVNCNDETASRHDMSNVGYCNRTSRNVDKMVVVVSSSSSLVVIVFIIVMTQIVIF